MFDYKSWIQRAKDFSNGLDDLSTRYRVFRKLQSSPSLTVLQLRELQEKLNRPLPVELQRFWLTAAQSFYWHYLLENADNTVWGGAEFIDALNLPREINNCKDWSDGFPDAPKQQTLWLQSVSFIAIPTGDYIGLYEPDSASDPTVIYLSHDNESRIIAPNLPSFLETWEQLCYLGPEIWMLEEFLDADGLLDANTPQAQKLRALFSHEKGVDQDKPLPTPDEMEAQCISNLKQICLAAVMYISDQDEILPDAQTWCDLLSVYDEHFVDKLICPVANLPYSYAMNSNLSGVKYSDIVQPERTVLFFESDLWIPNAHGTSASMSQPARHGDCNVIIFADSNVQLVSEEMQQDLKWTAE